MIHYEDFERKRLDLTYDIPYPVEKHQRYDELTFLFD